MLAGMDCCGMTAVPGMSPKPSVGRAADAILHLATHLVWKRDPWGADVQ